jgi:hypothetical protein
MIFTFVERLTKGAPQLTKTIGAAMARSCQSAKSHIYVAFRTADEIRFEHGSGRHKMASGGTAIKSPSSPR